jgi:hypothetical protein
VFYKYIPADFVTPCGYQECGLSGKRYPAETGLAADSTYYFFVNIDGGGSTEYSITTEDATDFETIIDLMNEELEGAQFSLEAGDLRCTSDLVGAASSIALAAGTSGTNLFVTLTGFTVFEVAVATEAGNSLGVDDEYAEAVVYYAAHKLAEENTETTLSDRFYAQFSRIVADFKRHRANNNTALLPKTQPPILDKVVT